MVQFRNQWFAYEPTVNGVCSNAGKQESAAFYNFITFYGLHTAFLLRQVELEIEDNSMS